MRLDGGDGALCVRVRSPEAVQRRKDLKALHDIVTGVGWAAPLETAGKTELDVGLNDARILPILTDEAGVRGRGFAEVLSLLREEAFDYIAVDGPRTMAGLLMFVR